MCGRHGVWKGTSRGPHIAPLGICTPKGLWQVGSCVFHSHWSNIKTHTTGAPGAGMFSGVGVRFLDLALVLISES